MKIRVLGSGAGGGFPQWNCNCRNCDGVRRGTVRAKARTQSSIFIRADDGHGADGILFNASPDILEQIRVNAAVMQPARAIRDSAWASSPPSPSGCARGATGVCATRDGRRSRSCSTSTSS